MADGAAFGGGGGFEGGVRGAGGGAEHGAAHDRVLSRAELEAMGVKELKVRSLVITPIPCSWWPWGSRSSRRETSLIIISMQMLARQEGRRGGEGRVPPPGGRQHPCNLLTTPDQALLVERGLSAEGCLEKTDFVNHVLLAQPGAE